MLSHSADLAITTCTDSETKTSGGQSRESIRYAGVACPTAKSRCMKYGRPTMAADFLLRGCVGPIKKPSCSHTTLFDGEKRIRMTSAENRVIKALLLGGLLQIALIKVRNPRRNSKLSLIWPYKAVYFTSPKGVMLLREWSKRKSFKPFYDAYCSHISEYELKLELVNNLMEGSIPNIPVWIKDKHRLEIDEGT